MGICYFFLILKWYASCLHFSIEQALYFFLLLCYSLFILNFKIVINAADRESPSFDLILDERTEGNKTDAVMPILSQLQLELHSS